MKRCAVIVEVELSGDIHWASFSLLQGEVQSFIERRSAIIHFSPDNLGQWGAELDQFLSQFCHHDLLGYLYLMRNTHMAAIGLIEHRFRSVGRPHLMTIGPKPRSLKISNMEYMTETMRLTFK